MSSQGLLCRLCLFKIEDPYDNENYLESSMEMLKIVDDIFSGKVKLTKLEIDNICSPCRDRLKSFHEYFSFVLENQKKFELFTSNEVIDSTREVIESNELISEEAVEDTQQTTPIKLERTEFITTIVKDEPWEEPDETAECSDFDEGQADFFHSSDEEVKEEYNDPGEITVKIDPDTAMMKLEDEPVEKPPPKKKKSPTKQKLPYKRRRSRVKLTSEERDEISREKDELIKRFIVLQCDKCPELEPFPDFSSLMNHSRREHQTEAVVKCCGREIKTKFLLASHLQLHVHVPTCEKCGETFRTNRKLESHRKIAHAICDICGVDLRRKKLKPVDVWAHEQQHALSSDPVKPTPFVCDLCGKNVKDRNRFKAHIKYQHYDQVACICEHCGTPFKFKHQYTEHKRIQHPNGGNKIPCAICGIAIRNNDKAMQAHIENVHRAQPTQCTICGLVCKSKKAMQTHFKRNHTEKKYICKICNKAFSMNKRLKEHEAIHLGVSLYTCEWCGAEFKSSGNFSAHKRKLHPVEYADEKARNQAKKYEL